jgi:PIN domain nuclease of toxin-antitoxin system
MSLLLDTCALLCVAATPERFSERARATLVDPAVEIFVSPLIAGELARLQAEGRLELPQHWKLWLRTCIDENGWNEAPLNLDIVEEAWSLPEPVPADAVDRILVATARRERLTLVTLDPRLLSYPHVETLA